MYFVTPRTGVWIETFNALTKSSSRFVTPRTGVWIETRSEHYEKIDVIVTPRTGVWIETFNGVNLFSACGRSHPARVCGLKQ